ncbi:MAG TPA: hypothetical protein VGC06_26280 [Actinomycetes bacterium]
MTASKITTAPDVVTEARNIASLLTTASIIRASVNSWQRDGREADLLLEVASDLEHQTVRSAERLTGRDVDYP